MAGVLAVIWLAAWVGTPIIAAKKGRSAVGWFLLAVLFGVFALIAVALVGERVRQPQIVVQNYGSQGLTGPGRECPHCMSQIPLGATVCRFCQRDVEPARLDAVSG